MWGTNDEMLVAIFFSLFFRHYFVEKRLRHGHLNTGFYGIARLSQLRDPGCVKEPTTRQIQTASILHGLCMYSLTILKKIPFSFL